MEKEGQEAGGLRRGAGGAGQEVCNGSLGGGQVRTEEVDEHRWIRGQMSLQSKDNIFRSETNRPHYLLYIQDVPKNVQDGF